MFHTLFLLIIIDNLYFRQAVEQNLFKFEVNISMFAINFSRLITWYFCFLPLHLTTKTIIISQSASLFAVICLNHIFRMKEWSEFCILNNSERSALPLGLPRILILTKVINLDSQNSNYCANLKVCVMRSVLIIVSFSFFE